MPTAREKRDDFATALRAERTVSGSILAAIQLTVTGWLAMSLPSMAVDDIPTSYQNTYRGCTGRLLKVGISSEAAANACANALEPTDVSRCVVEIEEETDISAEDALSACRQDRRPDEVARCVVGISDNSKEEAIPGVLDYCGRRSLLPVRFAECVVGLRRETEISPTQAMEDCVDSTDPLSNILPNFVPATETPLIRPAPPPPTVPGDQTPLAPSTPTPNLPGDQTSPLEPTPAPTAPPSNPGRV
jgi:hypothetical protein